MSATTSIYRSVNGLDLHADVYSPASTPSGFFVWFHGGALIMGGRADIPQDLLDLVLSTNSMLFSIGYRLAPQAPITEIAADASAGWHWATEEARQRGCPSTAGVVGGLSAGAYLALLVGLSNPRPGAVVSYYGYGTLDSPWYSMPSDHYRRTWRQVSEREALSSVAGPATSEGSTRPAAVDFYMYCRQNGRWPELAAGTTDITQLRRYSPTYHITREFPPTLLLHGTDDHDVPYEESAALAALLRLHAVEHEFISLEGFDHGLVPGEDPERIRRSNEATAQAKRFIQRHLSI